MQSYHECCIIYVALFRTGRTHGKTDGHARNRAGGIEIYRGRGDGLAGDFVEPEEFAGDRKIAREDIVFPAASERCHRPI